jgi:hypothetical protein
MTCKALGSLGRLTEDVVVLMVGPSTGQPGDVEVKLAPATADASAAGAPSSTEAATRAQQELVDLQQGGGLRHTHRGVRELGSPPAPALHHLLSWLLVPLSGDLPCRCACCCSLAEAASAVIGYPHRAGSVCQAEDVPHQGDLVSVPSGASSAIYTRVAAQGIGYYECI